jgi:catechol 2,3-dioxygenase-like lactoylglutathione lyase family enzyme
LQTADVNAAVAQVRIARPTDRLAEVERFYTDALGLRVIYRFSNHAGYDGVMIGLPDIDYHLEFTSHVDAVPARRRRAKICSSSISAVMHRCTR